MIQEPQRRFSERDIEIVSRQAGKRERLRLEQANEQLLLEVVKGPAPLTNEQLDAAEKRSVEARTMQLRHNNELFELLEEQTKERNSMMKLHRREEEETTSISQNNSPPTPPTAGSSPATTDRHLNPV